MGGGMPPGMGRPGHAHAGHDHDHEYEHTEGAGEAEPDPVELGWWRKSEKKKMKRIKEWASEAEKKEDLERLYKRKIPIFNWDYSS